MNEGSVSVGALVRKRTRRFLDLLKWNDEIADFREDWYLLESEFHIKGATTSGWGRIKRFVDDLNARA